VKYSEKAFELCMLSHRSTGDEKTWLLILAKSFIMQGFGKLRPFSVPFSVNREHSRQNSDQNSIPTHICLPDRKLTFKAHLRLVLRESAGLCMLRAQTQRGCAWATLLPCATKQSQRDAESWTMMLLL